MFFIGIDPHKASHTAAVIDGDEQVLDELSVRAGRRQRDRLLGWAAKFEPRVWAVEGASGVGAFLAQQLVRAGETVVDVPPALSARAHDCSTRAARTRPMCTTRARLRSSR